MQIYQSSMLFFILHLDSLFSWGRGYSLQNKLFIHFTIQFHCIYLYERSELNDKWMGKSSPCLQPCHIIYHPYTHSFCVYLSGTPSLYVVLLSWHYSIYITLIERWWVWDGWWCLILISRGGSEIELHWI